MLAGCSKNTQELRVLKKDNVALTQQTVIAPTVIDGFVKSKTVVGTTTTYIYDSVLKGGVATETLRADGKYDMVGKMPGKPDLHYIETRVVTGDITSVTFTDLQGVEQGYTSVNSLGIVQTMKSKRPCLGDKVSACLHSRLCMILCQAGGWAGCIFGWIWQCALNY